jgi:hypothetical protein
MTKLEELKAMREENLDDRYDEELYISDDEPYTDDDPEDFYRQHEATSSRSDVEFDFTDLRV